jgi:hypothetical protein
VEALAHVLGARSIRTLKTDDFFAAEDWLARRYKSAYRTAGSLEQLSVWLTLNFNLRLNYGSRMSRPMGYGRFGTDDRREEKLIPNEIIRDLFLARNREDLIARDRFFLSLLIIAVATGFRVGELVSLPADCLLRLNGKLYLIHHPHKGGKHVPRPVHPLLAEVVEDVVKNLQEETSVARALAKELRASPQIDWPRVFADREAARYFTARWAHDWTSSPRHLMINPEGAWYTKSNSLINVKSAYRAANFNKSLAARTLGISRLTLSQLLEAQEAACRGELPRVRGAKNRGEARKDWDTDRRVISFMSLEAHCGLGLRESRRAFVRDILEEAMSLQLQGKAYPAPPMDSKLEARFSQQVKTLLRDKKGKSILLQDEALLVVKKYSLTEARSTKDNVFFSVTDSHVSRWLAGAARSLGKGNAEDSVFGRLGIMDPRTGEVAKLTIHDIRHWLNTVYQKGGLTEDQIALIFNRRYQKENAVYDQTSSKVRVARLKEAVRDNTAVGQVAVTYGRLSDYSRDEAEDYLAAVLRMVNPMPHGVCTLDWATTPCPHHLSCFSCEDQKPCEHLLVEASHDVSRVELERLQREADLTIAALGSQGVDDSPTLDHFKRISRNIGITLEDVSVVRYEEKRDG